MTHAILLKAPGGPENLLWERVDVPPPGPGEATVRQTFVGLNFIDVYHRTGLYALPSYPCVLGMEAAGVVEAVGEGVDYLKPGDRVAYIHGAGGAYAEMRNQVAHRLVQLPDVISDAQGAAMMLKGLTVWYLLNRTFPVKKGTTLLVYAAAGGVGTLLLQWANSLGARAIGVVSNENKAKIARKNGAAEVVIHRRNDSPSIIAEKLRVLTQGEGVDVVYDSVGNSTFFASLDSLKKRGMMVSFGNASGPVAPFDPIELSKRGSLFLTRPSLGDYIHAIEDYREGAAELVKRVASGALEITIGQQFALKDAGAAHRALEAGETVGATVLVV